MKFRISYKPHQGINKDFESKITNILRRYGYSPYGSGFNFGTNMRDIAFDDESKHRHCTGCGRDMSR